MDVMDPGERFKQLLQRSPDLGEGVPAKIEKTPDLLRSKRAIFDLIPDWVGPVLDIGPGCGWETGVLLDRAPAGVEAITRFDEEAEQVRVNAPAAEVHVMDMHALPSKWSGQFGLVFASHVLEHSPAPLIALGEWYRVIDAGGVVFIVMPDANGYTGLHRERPTRIGSMPAHLFCASAETVIELLRHVGFEFLAYHEVAQATEGMVHYQNRVWVARKPA